MGQTWLNGYFFEFDDSQLNANKTYGLRYTVLTDLESEPVDFAFFKQHVNVDFDIDDNLLASYLKAARQKLEKYCQKSFGNKTIKLTALSLKTRHLLMHGPVISVESPENIFTLTGDYIESIAPSKNIEITYTVGWGEPGLPEAIKIAICQTAAGLYAFRENVVTQQKYSGLEDQAKKAISAFRTGYLL